MIGDWPTIIWSGFTASIGVILFAAGLHGYLLTASRLWQSASLAVAGLLLIEPGLVTDMIGAAIAGVVALTQLADRKRQSPIKATT
jgi:TRAP-type uncharacterized transport system fused permease subunit